MDTARSSLDLSQSIMFHISVDNSNERKLLNREVQEMSKFVNSVPCLLHNPYASVISGGQLSSMSAINGVACHHVSLFFPFFPWAPPELLMANKMPEERVSVGDKARAR